jgi:hypothetical protein
VYQGLVRNLVGASEGSPGQRAERRAPLVEALHADRDKPHSDTDRFRYDVNIDRSNEIDADAVARLRRCLGTLKDQRPAG